MLLASPASQAASPEQDTVRCVEIAFSQSVENRDKAAFTALLDADTRFISQEVLHGPEAVMAAWSGFFAPEGPQLVWRPYVVEVAASGDLALSRGPFRLRGKNPQGEPVESWGIYNSVWRKDADGQWKILFDAGNPGEQQLTEEMKALIDQPVSGCG
ncbi:MAG TPA: DUF4440 domain-containing protein [Xanthomonadales bacterium]|nr:DUF4440 domain-containing protein [Xanthomonadales bacterium]